MRKIIPLVLHGDIAPCSYPRRYGQRRCKVHGWHDPSYPCRLYSDATLKTIKAGNLHPSGKGSSNLKLNIQYAKDNDHEHQG